MYTLTHSHDQYASDVEFQHASSARGAAEIVAEQTGKTVEVRQGGKVRFRVEPSGANVAPSNATLAPGTGCIAGKGRGACFCGGCRARRAQQDI